MAISIKPLPTPAPSKVRARSPMRATPTSRQNFKTPCHWLEMASHRATKQPPRRTPPRSKPCLKGSDSILGDQRVLAVEESANKRFGDAGLRPLQSPEGGSTPVLIP